MIRVDAVWLAVEPLDMRAGTEAAMTRVVSGDASGPCVRPRTDGEF